METIISLLIPALISCAFGILSAYFTTNYRFRKQKLLEKEKEKEHIRLTYLNPLLVAGEDLLERILDIKARRKSNQAKADMIQWFKEIKSNDRQNKASFERWANDEGYFAMSTLYVTALYFSHASKIRSELPFIELSPGDDKALLNHISKARTAIGGKYGIWETIQDALGSNLIKNDQGGVMNYKDFCKVIADESEYIWFNRLIDFYRDVHKKLDEHIDNIAASLTDLIEFLVTSLKIKRTQFRIDDKVLAALKIESVPEDLVSRLEQLKGKMFRSEIDFVGVLVARVGHDKLDDHKYSILTCARLK